MVLSFAVGAGAWLHALHRSLDILARVFAKAVRVVQSIPSLKVDEEIPAAVSFVAHFINSLVHVILHIPIPNYTIWNMDFLMITILSMT